MSDQQDLSKLLKAIRDMNVKVELPPKILDKNPHHVKLTPARVAFNTVMGVGNDSDDFEFLSPEMQQRWAQALEDAQTYKQDYCSECGHPWLDHEFGVPRPYCP